MSDRPADSPRNRADSWYFCPISRRRGEVAEDAREAVAGARKPWEPR